jgi:A/G-specific adenine glycosylase
MHPTNQQTAQFQQKVISFYSEHKRDLPWRKTTDAYRILLSELMLQQTQVSRVVEYYNTWLQRWPTISDLALAKRSSVLEMWMGLGYNNRAVRLHTTAGIITKKYYGDVLKALHHYEELPGIGKYTAQAVQIFVTNVDMVTVDTNIRRILIHEFGLDQQISDAELWRLAERCLPKGHSREWHNALMDYGALYLTSKLSGIKPRTQQSRFQGSDRQVRAGLLRSLLSGPRSLSLIQQEFPIEERRLQTILDKMEQEGLIVLNKNTYAIKE